MKKYKGLTRTQRNNRALIKYLIVAIILGSLIGYSTSFVMPIKTTEEIPSSFNSDLITSLSTDKGVLWSGKQPFSVECEKINAIQGNTEQTYWVLSKLDPESDQIYVPSVEVCNKKECSSEYNDTIFIKNLSQYKYFKIDFKIDNFKGSKCFNGYEPKFYLLSQLQQKVIIIGNYSCNDKGICIREEK